MQGMLCVIFYTSCKYGPSLCIGRRNSFWSQQTPSLFPVKLLIIYFRSEVKHFVFSDILHRQKKISEEIRFDSPTWWKNCKRYHSTKSLWR